MNFLDQQVADYMGRLAQRFDDPVLLEMEKLAEQRKFPIVGRLCGAVLEFMARAIGARRVVELGSGFGFSAYWFARAVAPGGEVILTDNDPANAALAQDFLGRAGLWEVCRFEVGDAIAALASLEEDVDVIYSDIDKEGYPSAFELAKKKLKKGGLYICDNALWSGRVARGDTDASTRAIALHNEAAYLDDDFLPIIVPVRDGLLAALKKT